jgi:hypothetical protein
MLGICKGPDTGTPDTGTPGRSGAYPSSIPSPTRAASSSASVCSRAAL